MNLAIASLFIICGGILWLIDKITRINHAKELERYRSEYSDLTRQAMERPYWMTDTRYSDNFTVENSVTETNSRNVKLVFNNCNFYVGNSVENARDLERLIGRNMYAISQGEPANALNEWDKAETPEIAFVPDLIPANRNQIE